jgi:protein phosphatase
MAGMLDVARSQSTLVAVGAGRTDVGRRRDHNEDQILVNAELGVFAVADGMGGHQAGDLASSITASALEEFFLEAREPDPEIDGIDALPDGAKRLVSAVHHCNRAVYARSGRSANQGGMGSTIVAMHVSYAEQAVHIVHVGDSRCYRVRDGEIELLTQDHSMINEALRLNPDLSEDILRQLPTNVVTRALGTKESVQPDTRTEPLRAGDVYLLCSDGLSGEVSDADMLFSVLESRTLDDACELLVAMANEAGGRDNISALLMRVDDLDGSEGAPRSAPSAAEQLVLVEDSPPPNSDISVDVDDDLPAPRPAVVEDEAADEMDWEPVTPVSAAARAEAAREPVVTPEPDVAEIDEVPAELERTIDDDPSEPDLDDEPADDRPTVEYVSKPAPEEPSPEPARAAPAIDEPTEDEPISAPPPPRPRRPAWRRLSVERLRRVALYEPDDSEVRIHPSAAKTIGMQPVVGIGEMTEEPPPPHRVPARPCSSCGHPLDPGERFCGMCGTPDEDDDLMARCDACGHEVLLGTRYCVECGVRHGY